MEASGYLNPIEDIGVGPRADSKRERQKFARSAKHKIVSLVVCSPLIEGRCFRSKHLTQVLGNTD
jgi:hypothetical protein